MRLNRRVTHIGKRALVVAALVGILSTIAIPLADASPARPAAAISHSEKVLRYLRGIKEVTYMPSQAGWSKMWSDWKPAQIRTDLIKIHALGATSVRTIVEPYTFGWHRPTPVMQSRFDDFVSMARQSGLRVQVTLFDQFGNYNQISQSITFASSLLSRYKNSTEISFVEVQNEVDPYKPVEMKWVRALIPAVQRIVGAVPVTVSTSGADGIAGVRAIKAALRTTPPDFYDYHYYGNGGDAYTDLAAIKAVVAPAPLFIGETGFSTDDPVFDIDSEAAQAAFYASVEAATVDLGLPPAAVWTLNDFTRAAIPVSLPNREEFFGLYRLNGTPKPAAQVIKDAFSYGSHGTLFNQAFATVEHNIPVGWTTAYSDDGHFGVGEGFVSISASRGSISAEPAWTATINTGAIRAGARYRASVWARGVAATGISLAAIAWFGPTGTYIGNTSSNTLGSGTTGWTKLSLTATAPAGAASGVLSLQTYDNRGTVDFSRAGVAG